MKDSPGGFKEDPLTERDHQDPDKHWIGEALAVPTQTEIAATIGVTSSPGDSPFVARADHTHKLDTSLFPVSWTIVPTGNTDANTSASYVTWLVSDLLTVPSWAVSALLEVHLTGIYITTSALSTYGFAACLSTGSYGANAAFTGFDIANKRESTSFACKTTGFTPGGLRDVRIGAKRTAGTGQLRADTVSLVSGTVHFLPA